MTAPFVVGEATVAEIVELRRRVLRAGTPSAEPGLPEDDTPSAFHLAGRRDGEVVACVSFMPQPTPLRRGEPAWRFRAMAVDPVVQGGGYGRVILADGIGRMRALGVRVVWASARDSAIGFYESMGMHVEGDGYLDATTALPHHAVIIDL